MQDPILRGTESVCQIVDALVTVLGVLLTALLSGGSVAFYYQSRMKRIGGYGEITTRVMKKTLAGIEDVYRRAEKVHQVVTEIDDEISKRTPDVSRLYSLGSRHKVYDKELWDAVHAHRIYITSIVPFGHTGEHKIPRQLRFRLGDLCEALGAGVPAKNSKTLTDLQECIEAWNKERKILREHIMDVKKRLMKGEPII